MLSDVSSFGLQHLHHQKTNTRVNKQTSSIATFFLPLFFNSHANNLFFSPAASLYIIPFPLLEAVAIVVYDTKVPSRCALPPRVPESAATMTPTTATEPDGSEDVNDFLLRIRELGEKRDKEDEERTKKLEEDILQSRKERQARRAGKQKLRTACSTVPDFARPCTTVNASAVWLFILIIG